MSSLFDKLFGRLSKSRKRVYNERRLKMESLERRQVMANDLAALSGVVFTDSNDNGNFNSEPVHQNVLITLYRDGGNNTYDNGGGDDITVGTDLTDVNGVYRFDNLIEGKYYVQQAAIAGKLQRTSETVKTISISAADAAGDLGSSVDTFTTNQTVTGNVLNTDATSVVAAAEALGGQRELLLNLASGTSIDFAVNTPTPGTLLFRSTGAGDGDRFITYDGTNDNDAAVIDVTGLNNTDLTNGGLDNALRLVVGANGTGVTVRVSAYTSATNFSTFLYTVPNTGAGVTTPLIARYADFVPDAGGTGAVFTTINALTVDIISGTTEGQIDSIETARVKVVSSNFANLNPMSIGNLVFKDSNINGTREVTEPGIAGVDLELYSDTNANNAYDVGVDTLVNTTTTGVNGDYVFSNLLPGAYLVVIPATEFLAAAPLFGFAPAPGAPADPDTDIDNDDNGAVVGAVVATGALTLVQGGEPTNDGDADTNTNLTLDLGLVPTVDLVIVKTDSPDPVVAGNRLTYTLTLTNDGPLTANNVVATDVLPAGTTFVSANSNLGTVTENNGTVTVSIPTLSTVQTATVTIIVTVNAGQATSLTNTATIDSDDLELDTNDNSDSEATAVNQSSDLQIAITDSPDPVVSGGTLTWVITVTNLGPSNATGVTVSDVLPAGVTFGTVTTSQGTGANNAGTVTANLGNIAANGTATVTITATVDPATVGPVNNTVTVTGNQPDGVNPNNTATASTVVTRQVNLSITNVDSPDPVIAGNQVTYTLTVNNPGPSSATNVVVSDVLPAGLTFVSANASQGTATNNAGTVTGNLGTLNANSSATVTIVALVASSATGSISNTATVTSTETDTQTANNSATASTTVNRSINLGITKVDTADPIIAGNNVTYTITVTNAGPSDASNVVVTDVLPTGLTFVSATPSQGTANNASGTVTANLGTIAGNNGTATITLVALVSGTFSGQLSNTATVTATETDSNTANNTVTQQTTINKQVDLRVTMTDSADPVVAGNALTYTITVFNDGPSQATNVSVSDVLPTGVTFTSATASQGTATNSNGTVTAALGTIAANSSATVTITVGVNPTLRTNLSNTATATATETEVAAGNNSATQATVVNASADLQITMVDSPDPVTAGGSVTYTITVRNNGASTANGVTVTDTLPTGLTFTSGNATGGGTVTNNNGVVTGALGVIAPNSEVTMTIVAAVASNATGSLSNTASVTGTETDAVTNNNSANTTTTIAVLQSISGVSYVDTNNNGILDAGDTRRSGVTVTLTGTTNTNQAVNQTATTNANGEYTFSNLLPGTYAVSQPTPNGFLPGTGDPGSLGGTAGTNTVTNIVLTGAAPATANNLSVTQEVSQRRYIRYATFTAVTS